MSYFDDLIASRFADVERKREDLHGYQADELIPFAKANPFSMLLVDMGLGKSVSMGTLIVDLLSEFEHEGKVLIIGPLKVATEVWPTEFRVWQHLAPFNPVLIRESDDDQRLPAARARGRAHGQKIADYWELPKDQAKRLCVYYARRFETAERRKIRTELAHSPGQIHIISRDHVEWLVNLYKNRWPYRTVINDESSGFKDHQSGRFKALAKIRRVPNLITRLHNLTATPAAETYEHLWAQVYLLDLGKRLGKNITKYRDRYFTFNRWSRKYTLREGAEEDILERIADISIVMKAKDYRPIAEPNFIPRIVHLAEPEMDLYRRMEKDFLVELPDGTEVEAENAAALMSKLLQLASGVLYNTTRIEDWDTGDFRKITQVHHVHDHKIAMLQEIVEEAQGEQLLVAYHFKSSLARLQKAFPKATTLDRAGKAVKLWNAKKLPYPVMFIHPASGGHGLNLQYGGHLLALFDLPWSLELYLQLIGRLARQGQVNPVFVYLLIAAGTADEAVYQALARKECTQDQLFEILTRLIRKVRRNGKSL